MTDVVCIGEALIDLVPERSDADGGETFVKAAGGAPANVAVGVARLGLSSAFLGMVGDDAFGRFLAHTLAAETVDIVGMRTTAAAPTAVAVVTLDPEGDCDFLFYGDPAAHAMLAPSDLEEAAIRDAEILHFGTITLIRDPARAATLRAIELAHRHGVRVSLDPNLRLPLWPDAATAAEAMRLAVSLANVVKLSEDELRFLDSDACDLVEAARSLWHPALELVAVTRGRHGCLWLDAARDGAVPGFTVDVVDATGAGDAFTAALLAGLVPCRDPAALDRVALEQMVRCACAAGALAVTRRGAIPALPDRRAIEALLAASSA